VHPLNRAVSFSNLSTEIVQILLDNGADINLANSDIGRLLDKVMQHGTVDTLHLLLDRGVAVCRSSLRYGLRDARTRFAPDIDTLVTVERARLGDILQLFIDSSVDMNIKSDRGNTLTPRPADRY
jgi:ankyrin repeat protein